MVSSDSATGLEGTLKRRRRTYESDDPESSYKVISSAYESLDYDVSESKLYLKEERSKTRWVHFKIAVARWLIMFLIGALTAAVAAAIDITLDKVADWKHNRVVESINCCLEHSCLIVSIGIWVGISVALVLGAALLVVYLEVCMCGV
jgi:chloride channel 7